MKRLLALILLSAVSVLAQGAHITQNPWVSSRQGNPVAGASIAVCQGLATTAASVTSNLAVFTMASNPVTAGFVQGMTVQVSGFTGADTYYNAGTLANGALTNGLPILSVTPTTVTVSLVHANANATTNGSLVQFGTSVTPCAGLATIYTDASLATTTPNPFTSDGLGNYDASVVPGVYYVQVYGSGVTTTLRQITVPIVLGVAGGSIQATQVAFASATNALIGSANFTWDNTAKSLSVTNTGLSGIAPMYALALGVTSNEAGLVAQCQQLGNFFCEAGQFVASDSGAGPIGSVIGIASAPSHTAAGTLATMTGVDITPNAGNGAGAIATSRGIHVGGVSFPTGTSPTTHDGIIVDDQCAGSFPATNCTGIRVAAQSNGKPGVTAGNINSILYVGTGYYASLQAAHDALPSTGGTVFVTATGTPFGAGTTTLAMTKPMHIILDVATFTYTGTGQAILCTSVNAPIIEGSGFQGGGSAGGTIISVTNTAANGFDINTCPGAQVRNLNIVGPASGTGKGLIYTGNSGVVENVVVKSFGGNGCEEDGTRGNSNGVRWFGTRCVSNGGIGLNVFGANANLNKFEEVEVSSNTGLGAQIATATNILDPLHSFSNNSGGVGVSFISGASQNRGTLYSDLGTQTTDLAEAAGANNNKIGFLSGQNYTDAGTNNSSEMPRYLAPTASAATPSYSFQASNTTGFYDGGGGAVVFSSAGTAVELLSSAAHRLGSGKCIGWSSNADPTAAGNDSGLCRDGVGVIDFGNGSASDTTARLKAAGYISAGTKFASNAGCTEGTLVGGATAGKFTVGQNTACTIIITMGNTATAPNGWTCTAYDQTAVPAVAIRQTASTATTCSLLMTVATNDVITFAAVGF